MATENAHYGEMPFDIESAKRTRKKIRLAGLGIGFGLGALLIVLWVGVSNTVQLSMSRVLAAMIGIGIFLAPLGYVVAELSRIFIRSQRQLSAAKGNAATPERSLIFVVIVTLAWGMTDAFFLGQGGIAIILCLAGLFYFLPHAIDARRDGARCRLRLSKAATTSIVGFAALGIIDYGNVIARERAEKLIVAVEQFYAKHGRYPERLEETVPVFISEIPRAKYVVIADKFRYSASDSRHSLLYTVAPPFGRSIYTFEDRKWTSLPNQ